MKGPTEGGGELLVLKSTHVHVQRVRWAGALLLALLPARSFRGKALGKSFTKHSFSHPDGMGRGGFMPKRGGLTLRVNIL